jgi:predicted amidophosphoribosyltransferase
MKTQEFLLYSKPVWFISYYFPKKSGLFDDYSQLILDFKNKDPKAFIHFYELIYHWITNYSPYNDCFVCAVPSSKMKFTNAITLAAQKIAIYLPDVSDGTHFVQAVKSRKSFCMGAKRNAAEIINSIVVDDNVAGKNIILLDDVASSGISLSTIASLLLMKNAKSVCCLALAQTYQSF